MPTPLLSELVPLSKLLEKDEPKVVVVVGAGIAAGATSAPRASWLGLLRHGVEHLVATGVFTEGWGKELNASLNAAFSPFDLKTALKHAELVEQNLTTPDTAAFARWLRAAFGEFRVRAGQSETLDALRDLQQAGALLLTTNYDSLLAEATGLPPVTWEEHAQLFSVVRRQRSGILHIHGHWERPSSVVLGKSSYDRIAQDQDFQDVFKSLWLERSWLFVGCGDGLNDPNLGRLLEWGKRWSKDTPPDYFLAKVDTALALANRPDRPANLVSVGYADHPDLPSVLHALTPAARHWPFSPVDEDFALFRNPAAPLSIPFPSRQEYLDGEVPVLAADAEVRRRLEEHRWAFVLDVASVGKTTLALRIATAPEQRDHPSFYLDLATFDAGDADAEAAAAVQRLSRPTSLLILDNVHHQPEFARQLWDQWRDRPRESRLLLVATRMQRTVTTSPAQDLGFFEHHTSNPAIDLRPAPGDLGTLLKHLYGRVGGPRATPLPAPPLSVLQGWHREFGSALGAFCIAALGRLAEFRHGRWELPLEAASDWVREKWLKPLDAENRENLVCLAVFGAQALELEVLNDGLPHPGKTDQLLRLGLAVKAQRGEFGRFHKFSLREPGWGRLILAAQIPAADEETILFEAAARHPMTATVLSFRLRREGSFALLERSWAYIAERPDDLVTQILDLPVSWFLSLVKAAKDGLQLPLANRFWEAIEREPDRLAARAWETPLGHIASFLDTAKRHQRSTDALWEAIEREPDRLAARAWETPLNLVASFLDTEKRHQRNTAPLWEAIEREPDRLAARAWEQPLGHIAWFLDTAKRHQRNTAPLWEAIEREPDRLAACAWESPLGHIASFLDTAKRHQRTTAPLWEAIEREPDRLAARVWESPLGHIASFLDTAKRHQRNTAPLWAAIEREPDRLAARAWESSLEHIASFLDAAKRHQRNTAPLWEAIEREPDRLAARAWETPLEHIASFLDTARRHQRDTAPLWEAIEREPYRLAARAWETPLEHIASFLDTAKRHQRDTAPLWEAIEREPDRLAARAWEKPLGDVTSFLRTAMRHQRNTAPLWEAIEREPERLAASARGSPLEQIASYQVLAKEHGRDTRALWEALESKPEQLSVLAKHTSAAQLAGFCRHAPATLVKIALADFQTTHWDGIPISEPLVGATWVAFRCAEAGRQDLESALITTMLRRASPEDFPSSHSTSLANVAWLLMNTPSGASRLVPAFLDALCTKTWLGGQYANAACGPLAKGLRLLALHQPPQVCQRFQNPKLGLRLQKELSRFAQVVQQEQSHVIQLLGCATLCGWSAKCAWFNNVSLGTLGKLPVDSLPHRADAERVEDWQFQLWLGLRAVTSVTGKRLAVSPEVVVRTLDLWRSNLAESSTNAESAAHRANQSMVAWLESCSRENQGLLPPAAS